MRKRTKRMLSVLMAALMVVSIMPVNGSNNIVAKASTASEESSVVTWSAADILAAQEGDSGLVLCGSGWANNNATDDKTFEDGFSALGDNAKAGSTKAQTDGKTAAGTDYYYTYGNTLFIVLDTNNYNCATHENVMRKAIKENPNVKWKVVMFHQDIYGSGYDHSDSDGMVLSSL